MIPACRYRVQRKGGFARQKIVKNGNWSTPTSTTAKVQAWTPDVTYPGTVTAHDLEVVGAGNATVTLRAVWTGATPGLGQAIYLYKNGVSVASYAPTTAAGTRDITWTGACVAGDKFSCWAYPVAIAFTITGTTSWIELVPA